MFINSLTPGITAAAAQAANPQASAPKSATPSDSTESLFLSILVAELKTQDPTSPMDPTQMVGQMLSMNQLNELISIRQLLTGTTK
jgi:flagellar basal-body rod modification protein FlgD